MSETTNLKQQLETLSKIKNDFMETIQTIENPTEAKDLQEKYNTLVTKAYEKIHAATGDLEKCECHDEDGETRGLEEKNDYQLEDFLLDLDFSIPETRGLETVKKNISEYERQENLRKEYTNILQFE